MIHLKKEKASGLDIEISDGSDDSDGSLSDLSPSTNENAED